MPPLAPLLITAVGLVAARPEDGVAHTGVHRREYGPPPPAELPRTAFFQTAVWAEKHRRYQQSLRTDNYDWSEAYRMKPLVKDLKCSGSACYKLCESAFVERAGDESDDTRGVWGYILDVEGGRGGPCLERKTCWLQWDWERKEDVLVWKIGGTRSRLDDRRRPSEDIELTYDGFKVKGYRYTCK
ncbi:hypothetical protein CDD83_9531 [Cordyceps sp. RAO-2017]|nr:hypothetical protein CDD83_9531 [Cordyceps sp. RAO-2017]